MPKSKAIERDPGYHDPGNPAVEDEFADNGH